MAATEQLLGLIHEATASHFLNRFKEAQEGGEPLTPQELAQVIKFLKDNGIEALPTDNNKLGKLAQTLPNFDEEEPLHARH